MSEPLKLKFYYAVWLAVQAHVDGIGHWLQGHRTEFFGSIDLWSGYLGGISCEECPDTRQEDGKYVGLGIWSRHSMLLMRIGGFVCGLTGHKELKHPTRGDEPVLDQWYCSRCMADVKAASGHGAGTKQGPVTTSASAAKE